MNSYAPLVTFLEECKDSNEYWSFSTISQRPLFNIITNYEFHSDKSLVNFLNHHKNAIIRELPVDFLEQLEKQEFLNYLNKKWYNEMIVDEDIINPTQLLDLSLKYNVISNKDIEEYLREESDNYEFKLFRGQLHQ